MADLPVLCFAESADAEAVVVDLGTLVETRMLIVGSSRSGKTFTLYALLQQTFGRVQHFIIDREADYIALRAEYPYVVVGMEGDIPIDMAPGAVEALARELLRLKLSAIFDLSDIDEDVRLAFTERLCRTMADLPRSSGLWTPCLVVIDEAHHYAPEKGEGADGAEATRKAVASIASRGAKRGFSLIAATQRLASLSKAVSSLCENRFIMRTGPEDLKRAADALGMSRGVRDELRTLDRGTGLAYGPAIATDPVRVRVSADLVVLPPRRGELRAPPAPPPDAILRVLEQLPRAIDEATDEAADLQAAHTRIRDLEAELRQARTAEPDGIDRYFAAVQDYTHTLLAEVDALRTRIMAAPAPERVGVATSERRIPVDHQAHDGVATEPDAAGSIATRDAVAAGRGRRGTSASRGGVDTGRRTRIANGPRALVDAAARLRSIGLRSPTRAQVAVLAGRSPKSSATERAFAGLIRDELLNVSGPGCVSLTAAGERSTEPVLVPPTLTEHLAACRSMLSVPSQIALFDAMVARSGKAIARAELADAAGVSSTSSATERAMAWLISLDLFSKPAAGEVAAGPLMYPEGLR